MGYWSDKGRIRVVFVRQVDLDRLAHKYHGRSGTAKECDALVEQAIEQVLGPRKDIRLNEPQGYEFASEADLVSDGVSDHG